jgi:tRNA modification GTPase
MSADTIFALSSGAPPAAIAVVRISGPMAFDAVRALTGKLPPPRKASLRMLRDADGVVLDHALTVVFPGPATATGEDLAELHLHGGKAVVRAVETALAVLPTMRQAYPGEFTRRAFSNGRIDLNQAEGLADLLSAETEWQRRAAAQMVGGAFTIAVERWRESLLMISGEVEAILDFSDEGDVAESQNNVISDRCKQLHDAISQHLDQPLAEKLRDGLRVVIAGPPNSGKSTLLNALVARDAAIVSDVAGTTRDVIEIPIAFDGIAFLLTDTAGLRMDASDAIEGIGIKRAQAAIAGADIVLWLGDEGAGGDHPTLIEIAAKADLASRPRKSDIALQVSGWSGAGIAALMARLVVTGKAMLPPPDSFAINKRQRALLADSAACLTRAAAALDLLIIAEELRQARLALDALTGRASTEDMLDTLFGRFCIGK